MNINIKQYGKGKSLVFFHGWGFDSQIWLPLISMLEERYHLIMVDLPGFGDTPMLEWEDFKSQLLAQLPPKFALIGWSLGGLYATRLATETPDRVHHLVNITSSPRFIADAYWPGVPQELILSFSKKLSIDSTKTLNEFVDLQVTNTEYQFNPGTAPTLHGLQNGLNILNSWDLREAVKDVPLPICFMFGRLDKIVPIHTMSRMQLLYPDFHYVFFRKAAHMPFLSHTDLFINEICEFIQ